MSGILKHVPCLIYAVVWSNPHALVTTHPDISGSSVVKAMLSESAAIIRGMVKRLVVRAAGYIPIRYVLR